MLDLSQVDIDNKTTIRREGTPNMSEEPRAQPLYVKSRAIVTP